MNLPSRSEPCKKNEIKTCPPCFSIFLGCHANRVTNSLSGKDEGVIYIKITVAMCAGDATTPVAYEDHSRNEPMREYARCHHDSQ
jgi:hypothetical protein